MIDITEYIPRGKDATPKSRWQLECETGLSDRDVRDCINKAKKTYPIINVGGGYYIAEDPDDPNPGFWNRMMDRAVQSRIERRERKLLESGEIFSAKIGV